jgi:hypothetical protein
MKTVDSLSQQHFLNNFNRKGVLLNKSGLDKTAPSQLFPQASFTAVAEN